MMPHYYVGIASDWLKQISPHGTTNQKLYSDLGSDASSVWNFCGRDSHRRHFMGNQWWHHRMLALFSDYLNGSNYIF